MASRKAFLVRNLEDVEAYYPDDGDSLAWVAASGVWMPVAISGGSGVSDHGDLTGLADDDHEQYLLADGSRICSGDFTVGDGTGASTVFIKGASGNNRTLAFNTGDEARWYIIGADNTAESGSNVGSDFSIHRYDDAGAWIATVLKATRSTGDISMYKDVRIGGGLYVGGTGNDPIQGVIQSVGDMRAGGGLVVGSTSPNPASGYGVMSGGLSIGDTTPPFEVPGTLYFDFGTPSYGFISAPEPLFMSAGTIYDSGNWKQLGSSTAATFYISNTTGLVFRTDQTSRSPGDANVFQTKMDLSMAGNMRLEGGLTIGYILGTSDPDAVVFYYGVTRMGEIGAPDGNWLRINNTTDKPIYTPRYMRVDGGLSVTSSINDAGAGQLAATGLFIYNGATMVGDIKCYDTTWLRINETSLKKIWMPNDAYVGGHFTVGSFSPEGADGTILYYANLISYKNSVQYPVYAYHPYTTKKTSTAWDGDARSTTGATKIDLSVVFGIPAGVKAVQVRLYARDSAGHPQNGLYFGVGYSLADPFLLTVRPIGDDIIQENNGMVTCDANGDIYFRIGTSSGSSMDCWIEILGYVI